MSPNRNFLFCPSPPAWNFPLAGRQGSQEEGSPGDVVHRGQASSAGQLKAENGGVEGSWQLRIASMVLKIGYE